MERQASPEDYDDHASDGEGSMDDEQEFKQEQTSPSGLSSSAGKTGLGVKPSTHLQKRRRVTRACDECRRKKIKCDGKHPCSSCADFNSGEDEVYVPY